MSRRAPRRPQRTSAAKSSRARKASARPRSRLQRFLLRYGWLLPVGAVLVGGGILMLTYAFASIPLPKDIRPIYSAEVFDRDGKLIGTYFGEVRRFLIDTDELLKKKPFIGQAVIAAEDREFYNHNGVSLRGIARAAWANVTGGQIAQGGSTITQQYVKNAVLQDPSRTVTRKAKEAILAIKLERRYDKREILGFYLNTIYLGRGAYGIEAAARTYFGHAHADQLTLSEAAYLAGIIPSPESYQPDENQKAARAARDRVLDAMVKEGHITRTQADRAKRRKVKLSGVDSSQPKDQKAAYFLEWLRKNYLYSEYGDELYKRGFKIHTTLDLDMQAMAEEAVSSILTEKKDPQAALVSMTPRGEVRAFVGGRDFESIEKARGFNYAVDAPGRQPGSSFKPFTLMAAIEENISPTSTFSGASPIHVEDPDCATPDPTTGVFEPWEVTNFGDASYGSMTLDQATTNSVNTVYAQLVSEVGPEKVADMLEEFGFTPKFGEEKITANCSNALGGSLDVTPLEMARAYAGFAGRGRLPEVTPIAWIEDSVGNCIVEFVPRKGDCEKERQPKAEQVVEQNSADVLNQVLTHVVQSGTATVANIGRPVAGKTGTTQNFGNAWFAGYTPQLATVVWEGYPLDPGPDKKFALQCGNKIKKEDKRIAAQNKCGEDDFIPEMRYCADPNLCRPVHGYEVTGGGSPVSPAVIWASFMEEAMAGMEVASFPTPVDLPDEVLNSPAPRPTTAPKPVKTEEPEPEETEPQPTPSQEPEPTPTDEPSPGPTVQPTPTSSGGGNDEEEQSSEGDP